MKLPGLPDRSGFPQDTVMTMNNAVQAGVAADVSNLGVPVYRLVEPGKFWASDQASVGGNYLSRI